MPFATRDSIDRQIEAIANPVNRKVARAFVDDKAANGRKLSSITSQMNHVKAWADFLGERAFTDATKEDVRTFLLQRTVERVWRPNGAKRETRKVVALKSSTIELRKVVLRSFQRHARGGGKRDPLPPEVRWLERAPTNNDDAMPVDAHEILTRDDIERMIQAQDHPQGKAILATLYDSGMRASEFCSLRFKNIQTDEYGAVLTIQKGTRDAKTGARRVRVLSCTPYLLKWLNDHPDGKNANAPLWIILATNLKREGKPLRAGALNGFIKDAAKRAGIERRIWPHLFRHSRATECAKEGMSEMEMRIHFGWSRTSDMPARYIHLAGKDVDEAILRRAGKVPGGARPEPVLRVRKCEFCAHENPATAEFCENRPCGKPLDVRAAVYAENAKMDEIVNRVLALTVAKARATRPPSFRGR